MNTCFCAFVPPHVTDSLQGDDPEVVENARAQRSGPAPQGRARTKAPKTVTTAAPKPTGTSRREVYDSQNTLEFQKTLVRAEGDPTTSDADVSAAHDSAGLVRSFFKVLLERDSIDHRSMDLILNVHFGSNFNNAFWDGTQMTFGDGDGNVFTSFAQSLDVIGHELAHGVTQFTAGLIYKDQSGALNEHMSDVFGAAITQWAAGESPEEADWLIGNEIMGPTLYGEALRSMREPGMAYDNALLGKDPQPAHMDDLFTGSADDGGVHINSGIPNRAFYLAATRMGDTLQATRIWYHALRHMSPSTDFAAGRDLIVESARALTKSGAAAVAAPQVVRGAFRDVGL